MNPLCSILDTFIFGFEEYTVSHKIYTEKEQWRTILPNVYTIYADHKENITAPDFVAKMKLFLDKLVENKKMITYRITRMKLGFRSMDLPEFRIDMEFENMQQLDDAMTMTIADKNVDKVHVGFNQYVDVDTIQHFLYRDYPDELPQQESKKIDPELEKRMKGSYTVDEIVESMKRSHPEIWE